MLHCLFQLQLHLQPNWDNTMVAMDTVYPHTIFGVVAQWLERRSLTGELSLIYAWSMVDTWSLCG